VRKIIASVTVLMCLTSSASAMDLRGSGWNKFMEQNSLTQKVGWDQKNLDVQTRSTGHLISRIKKLEAQNEQLRNSISLIRAGKTSYGKPAPDPRILGLIDENKRLSAKLEQNRIQGSSTSFYVQQVNTLKVENQKLSRQVEELNVNANSGIGAGGGIMDDTSVLKTYMEENQLLKEALNQRGNGAERIVALQQQIEDLKAENEKVKLSASLNKTALDGNTVLGDGAALAKKDAEISSLKKELVDAQKENHEMSLALVETTKKTLNYGENADKATEAYKNNLRAIELLKQRLSKAQEENRELHAKVELTTKGLSSVSSEEIDALRQQNESLRDTIKAQSESLHSADNAAKTAERLLTENASLQHKIDLAQNSHSLDSKTAQEMMMRVKTLETDVARRDAYIKKMLAAKAVELAELSRSSTPNAAGHVASLRKKNSALADALDKEKENNIAYRRKIAEYQKEMARNKELEQASSSGVHRASIFERHVKTLEQKQQQAENSVAALKLENQELKARLDLLSEQTGDDVSLGKIQPATGGEPEAAVTKSGSNEGSYENGATFFDANYPSAERILPIFDEGKKEKNSSKEGAGDLASKGGIGEVLGDRLAVNHKAVNSETLLTTELTPLGESVSR